MSSPIVVFSESLKIVPYAFAVLGVLALILLALALLINSLKDMPGRFQFQMTVMGSDTKIEYDGQPRQPSESICIQPRGESVE